MAIKDFKNIEKINQELEQTAQIIKPADLNIFKTSAKSVDDFGLSKNDAIEFRLYDISNNLLEQTNGVRVRYIHKDELSKYLKNSLDTTTGEKIFEIDVEKLVFEAGYGNGEFRVSFSFVKNYVGNENLKKRVWIHEVSPSRTEIRVLPLLGSDSSINADLEDRYFSFMANNLELRQSYKEIQQFLDKIELNISTLIDDYFISSFGPKYIEVINKDFIFGGPDGYINFKNKIYVDFRQSVIHQINGKQFVLGSSDYGQQITNTIDLDDFVSNAEFRLIIENRLRDSIEYNIERLPKKVYTPAFKEAIGQYRPSKELQSILNTGYNSVTKLESIQDSTGVNPNQTNKTVTKQQDRVIYEDDKKDAIKQEPKAPYVPPIQYVEPAGTVKVSDVIPGAAAKPSAGFETSNYGFTPGVPIGPPIIPLEPVIPQGTSTSISPSQFYYTLDNETDSDQTITYNIGPNATLLSMVVPARSNRIVCANVGTVYGNVTKTARAGCGGGEVITTTTRAASPTTSQLATTEIKPGEPRGGGGGEGSRMNTRFETGDNALFNNSSIENAV
jgi:hypothetical protein